VARDEPSPLTITAPKQFSIKMEDGRLVLPVGNELRWGAERQLSPPAQPGFTISTFALHGDLVAYVVSTMAKTARAAATSGNAPSNCEGQELCTHLIRLLRLDSTTEPDAKLSRIPIASIEFVGPPVDAIAFGDGSQRGDLLLHFAGVDSVAALTWDRNVFKDWICTERARKAPVGADNLFTPAFLNFKRAAFGEGRSTQQMLETACAGT
jgi:hypothetical protein